MNDRPFVGDIPVTVRGDDGLEVGQELRGEAEKQGSATKSSFYTRPQVVRDSYGNPDGIFYHRGFTYAFGIAEPEKVGDDVALENFEAVLKQWRLRDE